MVVGMESGEPPDRRDVVQSERKLVAALEYVERGVIIPFVVEGEPGGAIFALYYSSIVGTIQGTDQAEFIRSVGRDAGEAFGLGAGSLIAPDHVEIDYRASSVERPQRVRRIVIRTE